MRAWVVDTPGPIDGGPLREVERPVPEPGPSELLVEVRACGVCRTDLHLAEGDLPVHRPHTVPGHEVVGVVRRRGPACHRFSEGDRVGIAWLRGTCGVCRFCRAGRENLCTSPQFTGWDADGGYAQYAVIDERYAYAIPDGFGDAEATPLLCAGIIGYRALRRTRRRRRGTSRRRSRSRARAGRGRSRAAAAPVRPARRPATCTRSARRCRAQARPSAAAGEELEDARSRSRG
jgi:zinc-binding alcohol dehydrogenase family protein